MVRAVIAGIFLMDENEQHGCKAPNSLLMVVLEWERELEETACIHARLKSPTYYSHQPFPDVALRKSFSGKSILVFFRSTQCPTLQSKTLTLTSLWYGSIVICIDMSTTKPPERCWLTKTELLFPQEMG